MKRMLLLPLVAWRALAAWYRRAFPADELHYYGVYPDFYDSEYSRGEKW